MLQAGVDVRRVPRRRPWLTALAWLGMHNYTYLWLKAGGRLSARDVAKPFADIFMRGISRPKKAAAKKRTWSGSGGRVAAVDDDGRAGGPAGGVAGEVGVRAHEVVGRAEPSGWRARWGRGPPAGGPSWIAERNVPGTRS